MSGEGDGFRWVNATRHLSLDGLGIVRRMYAMSSSAFDRYYWDANNWKLGFIYFCRADQRILVPKRLRGLGWTLNFARPLALPFLGFLLAVVAGVMELANSFGGSGDLRFAIKLLLALGLIAVCYRLSIPRADSEGTDHQGRGES